MSRSLLRVVTLLLASQCLAGPAFPGQAQTSPTPPKYVDLCHVYVVDLDQAEKMMEELQAAQEVTPELVDRLKQKYPGAESIIGEFEAKVGEEELTSRTYALNGTKLQVTASVYYTDEMMASDGHSDSMVLAIVASPKKYDNALEADGSAQSQMSYTWSSDKVQVKARIRPGARNLIVGLECKCRIGTLHPEIHGPEVIFGDRRKKK